MNIIISINIQIVNGEFLVDLKIFGFHVQHGGKICSARLLNKKQREKGNPKGKESSLVFNF